MFTCLSVSLCHLMLSKLRNYQSSEIKCLKEPLTLVTRILINSDIKINWLKQYATVRNLETATIKTTSKLYRVVWWFHLLWSLSKSCRNTHEPIPCPFSDHLLQTENEINRASLDLLSPFLKKYMNIIKIMRSTKKSSFVSDLHSMDEEPRN